MPLPAKPTVFVNPRFKWLLNLLLVFHLSAVFVPPFTFATRTGYESSPLADLALLVVQPYVDAMFLNHGYFFFAPNPGPSHLVQYEVEFKNGKKTVRRFPDRQTQWPRLFYHRHLMLAEWLHSSFPPATVPEWIPAREQELRRQVYQQLVNSYQQHLQHKYDARRITLRRLEHRLIYPDEYLDGQRDLNAPHLYHTLPLEPESESSRPDQVHPFDP